MEKGSAPFPWPADSPQFTACDPVANCAQACRNATANNAKRSSTTRPSPPFRGGSEFKADFERECRNRGLLPFPEINGHVERNNGAWRYCSMLNDDLENINRRASVGEFDTFRPHQALYPAGYPLAAKEIPPSHIY